MRKQIGRFFPYFVIIVLISIGIVAINDSVNRPIEINPDRPFVTRSAVDSAQFRAYEKRVEQPEQKKPIPWEQLTTVIVSFAVAFGSLGFKSSLSKVNGRLDSIDTTMQKVIDQGNRDNVDQRLIKIEQDAASLIDDEKIKALIEGIQADPYGRRHILTAWNPGELDQMALPPCHCFAQFYVADGRLSCQMYQRSADFFLGVPFNIASYSILTCMIAQVCGLQPGEFIHTLGDAHIYLDHVEQVKEQLIREPLPMPQLYLNPEITDITKFTMADIRLENYQSHNAIKAPMAV